MKKEKQNLSFVWPKERGQPKKNSAFSKRQEAQFGVEKKLKATRDKERRLNFCESTEFNRGAQGSWYNGWHASTQVSKIEEPKQVNKKRIRKRNGYSHEQRLQAR